MKYYELSLIHIFAQASGVAVLAVSLPRRWCACRFQPAAQRVDADAEFRGHLPAGPPLLGDHPHCPRLEGLIVTRRRWVLSFFG